ncbi:M56 family metallopeptidase [Mucilaginibacter myungsuensis]|uniref:M56 family metallopeptidase n=1 Tax=Mucilaginibacter myungsuensis TaxID=649104 RepID=A0A929PY06_9SPHI|nr:M56 family metallopeptidase [Mucilaginibacter myungsuensis]MBE9662827.1 M56 family metallopeptidase [Mucilaginibacter myungsuensis]MDN3598247.1 M56 family metallopeptidase [Mucilaginibacter myungsuensis]
MMYMINFVLCSGLLLAVYKLFLQNERMYRFNRFYLLFSLVFSAMVPFVVITTETESIPVVYQEAMRETLTPVFTAIPQTVIATQTAQVDTINYGPMLIIGAYLLIAVVLILRFAINLYKIGRQVIDNENVNHQQSQVVLTDAEVTPHSFLKYIFINRIDHETGSVEPEVICHEQAHVRQWHSLDVLLVEVFQALCWFNPFIPLYRKAIQLNHEFLADEAVTNVYDDTPAYQYLLLVRASQPGSLQLSSQFNYQTTKKRLMMMTKTTSAKMAWGKKLMLLPVAALAVILFSEKVQAKVLPAIIAAVPETFKAVNIETGKDTVKKVRFPSPQISEAFRVKSAATNAPQSLMDEYAAIQGKYLGKGAKAFAFRNVSAADKAQMDKLYQQMSRVQQDKQRIQFGKAQQPHKRKSVTADQLEKWQDKIYDVQINWKLVSKEELAKYTADDFDWMNVTGAGQWAFKDHGAKKVAVLMTKAFFASENKKIMADRSNIMWVRSSVD